MKKFKEKGWVIKLGEDYLIDPYGDDFDTIDKAYIFKRKKVALVNMEEADNENEKIVKVEKEIIIKFI